MSIVGHLVGAVGLLMGIVCHLVGAVGRLMGIVASMVAAALMTVALLYCGES